MAGTRFCAPVRVTKPVAVILHLSLQAKFLLSEAACRRDLRANTMENDPLASFMCTGKTPDNSYCFIFGRWSQTCSRTTRTISSELTIIVNS